MKRFSPDIVFLLDSKLLAKQVPGLARKIGFLNFYRVDRVGLSGGLSAPLEISCGGNNTVCC